MSLAYFCKMEKCQPVSLVPDGSAENADPIPLIIVNQLPDSQREPFRKWLKGQTVTRVQGHTAAYAWDYNQWFQQQ